jgi:hypothetical protein
MNFEFYFGLTIFSIAYGSHMQDIAQAFMCFGGVTVICVAFVSMLRYLNRGRG